MNSSHSEFTWKHNYTSEDTFKPTVPVNVQHFQMQVLKFLSYAFAFPQCLHCRSVKRYKLRSLVNLVPLLTCVTHSYLHSNMYTSHDAEILSEYYLLHVKSPKVTIFPKHKLQSCNIITPVTYSLPVPNPDMVRGQICSSLVWTLLHWLSFLCNAQNNVIIIQLCLWTLIFAYTTWLGLVYQAAALQSAVLTVICGQI